MVVQFACILKITIHILTLFRKPQYNNQNTNDPKPGPWPTQLAIDLSSKPGIQDINPTYDNCVRELHHIPHIVMIRTAQDESHALKGCILKSQLNKSRAHHPVKNIVEMLLMPRSMDAASVSNNVFNLVLNRTMRLTHFERMYP